MRIYLCASYERRDEMRAYAAALREQGHEITSQWLEETNPLNTSMAENLPWSEMGQRCLSDIDNSDAIIAFTEPDPTTRSRGGRHVELGYAIGKWMYVIVVGPRENVFCHLPEVYVHENWEECLKAVKPKGETQ